MQPTNNHFSINLDEIPPKEKMYSTHNFHPYPAKYIPQIPQKLMEYLSVKTDETILDPFCGSGTTLVEANLKGLNGIGIDSNPIACLVSKVKTTKLSLQSKQFIYNILDSIKILRDSASPLVCENIPQFLNRDHWFQQNMLIELATIKSLISEMPDFDAKDFLNVALSAIIVKVSNQESDTRWVAKDKNLPDGFAMDSFIKKASDMLKRINEFSILSKGTSTIYNSDSRYVDFLEDNCVDYIITSPPYLNSFDYYLYHKLRMYWLGYDHYKVQKAEIGSRNKHCDNNEESSVYFDSIFQVIDSNKRLLKNNGYYCVVIGDSIVKNNLIEMDKEYEFLFSELNFTLVDKYSFDQRKYTRAFTQNMKTKDKKSHIIIFRNCK